MLTLPVWLLWFTSLFLPAAVPQGVVFQPGSTPPALSITQLCAVSTLSCTITANVSSGNGIFVSMANESSGAPPALTFSDSCSDGYSGQQGAGDSSAGAGVAVQFTKATCNMTSGSSTISVSGVGSLNTFYAYAISPFAAGSQDDQSAVQDQSASTSWSVGPTSAITGSNDVCFASAMGTLGGLTYSVGAGWTIGPGTNNNSVDNRTAFTEYKNVTSGTVTATATASGSAGGGFVVKCLKLQ